MWKALTLSVPALAVMAPAAHADVSPGALGQSLDTTGRKDLNTSAITANLGLSADQRRAMRARLAN